jgi:hypothetical protein
MVSNILSVTDIKLSKLSNCSYFENKNKNKTKQKQSNMSLSSSQFTELRTMLLTHAESEGAKHGSWKDDLSEYTFNLFNLMKTFVEANLPEQDELVRTKIELAKTTFELEKTTIKLEKASGICFSKTEELRKTKLELEKSNEVCLEADRIIRQTRTEVAVMAAEGERNQSEMDELRYEIDAWTKCESVSEPESDACPGCEKHELNPYDDSHCSMDGSVSPKCLLWNPPASTHAVHRTGEPYGIEGSNQSEINLESLTYNDTDEEEEDEEDDESVDGMRHGWSVDWPGLLGA